MPHQNTSSSQATSQNSATEDQTGNDMAREQQRSVRPEPRSYVAADYHDASLAAPAAGEMADYADEGDALDMAGSQQGSNHNNRPDRTDTMMGQGPKTRRANRRILKTGEAN